MNQSKSTRNSSFVTRKVTQLRKAVFPFMELPPELRNCVYEFLIEDTCTVEADLVNDVAYLTGIDHFHGTHGYPREISSKFPILLKTGTLRASIRGCHLNEVSRTIRREFLSMLWSRTHLRYCCCFRTRANKPRTISLDLLRGNVTYVLWDMSIVCGDREDRDMNIMCRNREDRAMRFVEFLKMVDFRGTIKLQGEQARIENLREALEGIAVADDTKKAQRIAMQKVEEVDEPDRIVALERRRCKFRIQCWCIVT